jgi:cellulose synthase/poly-beta-1,6-N-acetylglucosamine synthase-like glycosyltransferase
MVLEVNTSAEGKLPKVSIVIPVKNEERTIRNTIQSILELDYPDYEVILVDAGSEDQTASIAKQIRGNPHPLHKNLKIIQTGFSTPAHGRNIGIRNSSGEILAFVDGDCYVTKDWLKKAIPMLRQENVGGIGGPVISSSRGKYLSRALLNIFSTFFASAGSTLFSRHRKQKEVENIPTGNSIYHRKALEEIGLFDKDLRFCEDVDLSYRVKRAGYRLIYSPDVVTEHDWKVQSLRSLFGYMVRYGIGRGVAGKKHRYLLSPLYAVPSTFLLFAFFLLLSSFLLGGIFTYMAIVFISVYTALAFLFGLLAAYRFRDIKMVALAPVTYLIGHVGYAIGFIWGLFKREA